MSICTRRHVLGSIDALHAAASVPTVLAVTLGASDAMADELVGTREEAAKFANPLPLPGSNGLFGVRPMSDLSHKGPSIASALERLARDGATAAQVASEVAEAWRRVEASLSPIIGAAGVAAVYRHSLWLASRSHPWLTELHGDRQSAIDVEGLTAALVGRGSSAAALGGGEHLESFYGLLTGLIGPTLTRRWLSFLWQSFEEPRNRHE